MMSFGQGANGSITGTVTDPSGAVIANAQIQAKNNATGQIYTANGGKIAVWNQPVEVREMRKDGRWTIEEIAERLPEVGQEELGLIKLLAEREAAAKAAKESGTTPNQ